MIVKNEVETIGKTLESVRGAVDFVTVVDTGSTDGTQEAVTAALAGTLYQLVEHPFEDFSTTRNWALRASLAALQPLHGLSTQCRYTACSQCC